MTLDELMNELKRGRVYTCAIRSRTDQVFGLTIADGQDVPAIYIDERLQLIEVLIHELLHRSRPRWKERHVRKVTKLLLMGMDEATKQRWWRAYRRARVASVPLDHEG